MTYLYRFIHGFHKSFLDSGQYFCRSAQRALRARSIVSLTGCLFLSVITSSALVVGEVDFLRSITAMDVEGLDPELSDILSKHYAAYYGGHEAWSELDSVSMMGQLILPEGKLEFIGYKMKPNFCKLILMGPQGSEIVMGYDGEDTWQSSTVDGYSVDDMDEGDAKHFIRDAGFGSHLLYPKEPGKQIRLLGTRIIDGHECYDIEVRLPSELRVFYAIDTATYLEREQILINAVTGLREVLSVSDLRNLSGIVIPFRNRLHVNGELIHEVNITDVVFNLDLTAWIFKRPTLQREEKMSQELARFMEHIKSEAQAFKIEESILKDSGDF